MIVIRLETLRWPCFSREFGLDDLWWSLPTSTTLWFCNTDNYDFYVEDTSVGALSLLKAMLNLFLCFSFSFPQNQNNFLLRMLFTFHIICPPISGIANVLVYLPLSINFQENCKIETKDFHHPEQAINNVLWKKCTVHAFA